MILYVGMGIGSVSWGFMSDTFGRRFTFNSTLLITGVFGILISLGPTWAITALLFALMGFGVGGNLPVDGALFLEFLPTADTRLLTLLSAWWPAGQLFSALSTTFTHFFADDHSDMFSCMVFHSKLLLRRRSLPLFHDWRRAALLCIQGQPRLAVLYSCHWCHYPCHVRRQILPLQFNGVTQISPFQEPTSRCCRSRSGCC